MLTYPQNVKPIKRKKEEVLCLRKIINTTYNLKLIYQHTVNTFNRVFVKFFLKNIVINGTVY